MKLSLKYIIFFFLSINFNGFSQVMVYSDSIPVDKSIKKGVLANGLTYYLKRTDAVKEAASYYIIQNVGSILENDNQQGLAHFLEHMAFNGTKKFPGKAILNTLQKHGAVFGKDINAYTSFDETVYNLTNIPTQKGLVDTCLTVLRDWSNYLLLTDKEIDAERAVIKEEWRSRQNGYMRLFQTSLPVKFNYSKYAERLPIGLMSVVEGFEYKALRDFYHDWYRTDLQAIAIIGDINIEDIEQRIIDKFSKIPAVSNPRTRFVIDIPSNKEMLYSLGMDPEVSTPNISFGIRHKKVFGTETITHLKRDLLESMVTTMLSARIEELAQKPKANFLRAFVGYKGISRTSNALTIEIVPKPNQQKEAFSEVFTEILKAVKFGYLPSEIERTIAQIRTSYENKIAKKNDISHAQILRSIQKNYLENKTISDVEKEFEIVKNLFNKITKEDVHNAIKDLYTQENRYLNVTGVEGQENLSEAQAKDILFSVENNPNLEAYSEVLIGNTLVSGISIKKGEITSTQTNDDLGSTTFTLSNGIKVHYKYVNKEKDKVILSAYSYGGTSLLSDEDLPSATLMSNLVEMSGLGDFTSTDLRKVLAGKTANVKIRLNEIDEKLSGYSNTKDVETMLQMVYLYFVKPRFDKESFKVLQSNFSNYITRRSKDIGEKMRDSLTITLYGKNNPKERLFNEAYAADISFDKIKSVYKDRFADASDFEFILVGDIKKEKLKPLLEKYISSIPTKNTVETFKDNGAAWLSEKIDEDIYLSMKDPKAHINIAYKKEMPYTIKSALYTDALGDILQLRVIETVREFEGGAYSPKAFARFFREPKSQAYVSVSFDCNPDLVAKLVNIVQAELQKMKDGHISDDDMNKIRTNFLKERKQSKDKNSYDMQLLRNFYKYNFNMNDPDNFENIVSAMSKENIQKIAKELIGEGQSYKIVFKPKGE